ncbi:MAG: hypothetical protein ACYCTV_03460 [Leptospirales bacterium]
MSHFIIAVSLVFFSVIISGKPIAKGSSGGLISHASVSLDGDPLRQLDCRSRVLRSFRCSFRMCH